MYCLEILRFQDFQVCFATCFDPDIFADLQSNKGKLLRLKPTSAEVVYRYALASIAVYTLCTHNLFCDD
jgi:hypothetical protein